MKAYHRLQLLVATFLLAAGLIPPVATLVHPAFRGEVFPLSMWAMFYRVHNVMDDFAVRILEVGPQRLDPPPYFEDAARWFPAHGSIEAYHVVQALGRALRDGHPARAAALRTLLEAQYLGPAVAVRYELVRRRWDPIERWQRRTFLAEEVLETYRAGPVAPIP